MMKRQIYKFLFRNFPILFNQVQHYRLHKMFGTHAYWANIQSPRTFNEKILYDKVYGDYSKSGYLVDKDLVKDYVAKVVSKDIVIPTIAILNHENELDQVKLKFPCIIKPTHASARVLIFRNDSEFKNVEVKNKIKVWLKENHFDTSGEPQYKSLVPKVIIEELLVPKNGQLLDYKIFCFKGVPHFVQVDLDRFQGHKRAIYDIKWEKQDFTIKYPLYKGDVPKPERLSEMLEIAQKLAQGFSFVRVDLYAFEGKIFFGELTFHHESGYGAFSDFKYDLAWGQLID